MPSAVLSKKNLVTLLKVGTAVVILYVLFRRIQAESGFERLINEPKQWPYLIAAQIMVLMAFSLSYVRWFLLVRGLDLQFRLSDAFRLGTLGFMLNQISPGSVGGDLLKAVFIAREQPGKRTEAVATVFVDRIIGLYGMLLIASVGLALAGDSIDSVELRTTLRSVVWTSAIFGTLGLAFVLSPLATSKPLREFAKALPIVGATATKLIEAADVYRSRRSYLFAGFAIALLTHGLLITAFWSISQGLPVTRPTFLQNASLVPVCLVAGAVIPTPGGLGGMEGSFEFLYSSIGSVKGDGTIVAIAYRSMTYLFAAIGAFYYFTSRRNVDQLLHEAEHLGEEPSDDPGT